MRPVRARSGGIRVLGAARRGAPRSGCLQQRLQAAFPVERGEVVEAADVVLAPGEMSLHHVRIVHGSSLNRSPLPRFGYAIRYIPTYCRQSRARTFAALARGEDSYGHFDRPPRPEEALSEAAWAAHAESLRRLNAVMMYGAAQDSKIAGYGAGSMRSG